MKRMQGELVNKSEFLNKKRQKKRFSGVVGVCVFVRACTSLIYTCLVKRETMLYSQRTVIPVEIT